MQAEGKFCFFDTAGKFEAAKEELREAFHRTHDLVIYSLTPEGEKTPTHLVLKMTPIGKMDDYLSLDRLDVEAAAMSMRLLDYQTFPVDWLKRICESMRGDIHVACAYRMYDSYVRLAECTDQERYCQIPVKEFFRIEPRKDELGAQVYLRDKAFFLSLLPDPEKPAFSVLTLLPFASWSKVKSIDMTRADVSGRTTLKKLFEYYSGSQLDLSAFNTANVTDMSGMFMRCRELQRVDLSSFDFGRVKTMASMFEDCRKLQDVVFPDMHTAGDTDMSRMFYGCRELQRVDLSSVDFSCVQSTSSMFEGCEKLEEVVFSDLSTAGMTELSRMFCGCASLRRVDLSAVDFRHVKRAQSMFDRCPNLEEVILSDTIFSAGLFSTRPYIERPYTTEELNQIYRSEYIAAGPNMAQMATERATVCREEVEGFSRQVAEDNAYRYFDLEQGRQKLTIVPHGGIKK